MNKTFPSRGDVSRPSPVARERIVRPRNNADLGTMRRREGSVVVNVVVVDILTTVFFEETKFFSGAINRTKVDSIGAMFVFVQQQTPAYKLTSSLW